MIESVFSQQELLCLAWQKPVMAQLEVTANCNQRCCFCFNGCGPSCSHQDLPIEVWKKIIGKLKNLGVTRLDFTGGEPLLYQPLVTLIDWANAEGFETSLNTNGTIEVRQVLPLLNQIIFSVHGLNQVHNQVVGHKSAFDLLEKNIALAQATSTKVILNMFLVQINYEQLLSVWRYFNALGRVDQYAPAFAIQSLFGNNYRLLACKVTPELLEDYQSKLKEIPPEKLVLKHGFQSIYINDQAHYDRPLLLPNCAAGKYKLIVDASGDVYPCNFFRGKAYFCGNMIYGDEQEIWANGAGFQPFRKLVLENRLPEKCQNCLKKARCQSGCRAWSEVYQQGGFYHACDFRCELGSAYLGS